jgi:hypothetical protein
LEARTGDQVPIGGFIVAGGAPKRVILRAIGPSLADFGITDTLADPVLELHAGDGSLITSNDNWKLRSDGSSQEADISATGIPPANILESAIVITLDPGNYTAVMSGKDGGTGVGLIEVYDLDQGAVSQLANISTRGFVGIDTNVMIGGFILGPEGSNGAHILARAIAPSLADFGVLGTLPDPVLELHDANGVLLVTNDNWKLRSDGSSQQAEIEATTIPPSKDLESAIVDTLPPGNYTVVVAGKNGLTGVALVEVYRLSD